jgi:hypothetical protein
VNDAQPKPSQLPHPVVFDVEYPERHSRWLIFVKWLLVFPQLIISSLLGAIAGILGFFAWFAILFTGRYPRSMFDFSVGCLRWSANVSAYYTLLVDEYPPFSFDEDEYPLTLQIPYPERQSRWRLFIRWFAIIPNQIVFFFVQLAWYFTSFIAWWAILFTGHYPRGLFRFAVGVLRWSHRSAAYTSLLTEQYPPYSTRADARPGNEVVSAIIGLPLFAGLVALYVTFFVLVFAGGTKTVTVDDALLQEDGGIARVMPVADAGRIEITLEGFGSGARLPGETGTYAYFDVRFEKDGFGPTFYTPYLFFIDVCRVSTEEAGSVAEIDGEDFRWFWGDGETRSRIYFEEPVEICELRYFSGFGFITFQFE